MTFTPFPDIGHVDVIPTYGRGDAIKRALCQVFDVSRADLDSYRRTPRVAHARQAGYLIFERMTYLKHEAIAHDFNRRDRSSISTGIRRARWRMERNPEYRRLVERVMEMVRG